MSWTSPPKPNTSFNAGMRNPVLNPVILSLMTLGVNCDTARDGQIVVNTRNMRQCSFLWTSGVVTSGTTLHDVKPGTYSAHPIEEEGTAIKFMHTCEPAVVKPARI